MDKSIDLIVPFRVLASRLKVVQKTEWKMSNILKFTVFYSWNGIKIEKI